MMFSHQEAQMRCPDKKTLYQGCIRNQYLLSPFKDAINTVRYLQGVQSKRYWALTSKEIRAVKFCADPPVRKEIAQILYNVMMNYRKLGEPADSGMKRTAKYIRRKPPQAQWMLLILGSLEPDHFLFAKDYVNPRRPLAAQEQCDSHDGFYEGLPIIHNHRGRTLNLMGRGDQKRMKLYRMQQT